MHAQIDAMKAQLAAAIADGPGTAAWQAAVDDLRADLSALRARVAP